MKNFIYCVGILIFSLSCQETTKKKLTPTTLTVAEKIAKAHGYDHWKHVIEVNFTFAGKRQWQWQPKTNNVTLITEQDTISYNRNTLDSTVIKFDRAFINDKFWLFIPFQLVWDKGTSISDPEKVKSPIKGIDSHKITLTYGSQGGYTPGDAYDIYYDENFIITEWAFRKGNKPTAGLINTFENYHDYNGLKLASSHKKSSGDWDLQLTNISIKFQ
ncbi:hypothetical protein KFZ70_01110 [Tamlana fucoidanivorans]|uniref:Uncharacterized protein n=1 Tax=Allotamlana fucoidanivorans TaxID=2583814 RepID=A0A5C4SM80_9FLAO|nr:hypothetical protein [Tamlana fucoidanivorans]TNJ44611.1 hypothetical protein FGF67_08170 [Tamlana fucoidanivorans]